MTFHRAFALVSGIVVAFAMAAAPAYDPLALPHAATPVVRDFVVHDPSRDRDLPVRVFLPERHSPAPVVLFSHGLGGSKEGNAFLGAHWAARGYVVVYLQHPGSDADVWKNAPAAERTNALRDAADLRNFLLRARDVGAVLDALTTWNKTRGHALDGRLDLTKVGMSGHSFGAVTTQAVSGERFRGRATFTDPRIKAAVAFSPSSPHDGDAASAFGAVRIPWMLMTGTHDIAPIGETDLSSRLAVFPALPPGHKYEVVLNGAEHSAFGDRGLPGDEAPRNPNHHKVILALSTAFWDTYLRGDAAAAAWLDGNGPRSIMEKEDRWQTK